MSSPPIITLKNIREVHKQLNDRSPSLCLAKWLQVTVHLQNGQTHSCHHPKPHKIQLHEVQQQASALHNTSKKMLARKEMLEGIKPSECEYCWKIEDIHPDNLSDRAIKSAQAWAHPRLNEVASLPWTTHVAPSYMEVSFGNECNFRCAYCNPYTSSSLMNEMKKHGTYSALTHWGIESLKAKGLTPYSKDDKNPYVDAFWKWWPKLSRDLKVFRITGGEPLLNPNTFRFLEFIKNNPMPDLTIAINSNLGVNFATFNKFIQEIKFITDNKLVKEFQLFTSVDTHGKHAEFVRFGLNYAEFMEKAEIFLKEIKDSELIFMCTYNAFSVYSFNNFLKDMTKLKSAYWDSKGRTRVTLDIPYLKEPTFLSCYVLTKDFLPHIEKDIEYMKQNATLPDGREIFYPTETVKLERILNWIENLEESEHRNNNRRALSTFIREYEQKKGIRWRDYIPEYAKFIKFCDGLLKA